MMLLLVLLIFLFIIQDCHSRTPTHCGAGCDSFVTRPDIFAPKWNVTIYDESALAPGYWFMAPAAKLGKREPGEAWIGPHVYDQHGMLIWSGAHLFNNINTKDFTLATVKGVDRLTMMYPNEGLGYVLDNHYEVVEKIPVGIPHQSLNMHEFNFVNDGKALLLLTQNNTYASEEMSGVIGFDGKCHVSYDGFMEIDTETWETTFAWSTLDHIGLDESTADGAPVEKRCNRGKWDFMHTNALDKFDDGHYLFSGRNTDTLYKVDKNTGEILWRAGGKYSDFDMGAANFSRQHHARFVEQNATHTILSVMDNAKSHSPQAPTSDHSSGKILSLDMRSMRATLLAQYHHPHGGYTWRRGNLQILPNQNAFLCWSERSLQSEHTQDGRMIMEAELVPDIGTYRSRKYEFVGLPAAPPDLNSSVVGLGNVRNATQTTVHVSWNGATEVRQWRFYKTTETGDFEEYLGLVEKRRFESVAQFNGYLAYVVVEGVDKDGQSLGRSKVVKTEVPPHLSQSIPDINAEMEWLEGAEQKQHGSVPAPSIDISPLLNVTYFVLAFISGLAVSAIVVVAWRFRQRRHGSVGYHEVGRCYSSATEKDAILYEETELDDSACDMS